MAEEIDYTKMSNPEISATCGDDASKWAAAFVQIAAKTEHSGITPGWMTSWFAAAIEHSSDVRRWRREAAEKAEAPAIKAQDFPAPDTLIDYGNGTIGCAMFHFAGESGNCCEIAEEQGFRFQSMSLEYDLFAEELAEEYLNDGGDVIGRWNPQPPAGWKLAAKHDTEDGPVAFFIKKMDVAEAHCGTLTATGEAWP